MDWSKFKETSVYSTNLASKWLNVKGFEYWVNCYEHNSPMEHTDLSSSELVQAASS